MSTPIKRKTNYKDAYKFIYYREQLCASGHNSKDNETQYIEILSVLNLSKEMYTRITRTFIWVTFITTIISEIL